MMWAFLPFRLTKKIVSLLQQSKSPMTIDQMAHHLLFSNQSITNSVVISGSSIRRKNRLKLRLGRLLENDKFKRTWIEQEFRYSLTEQGEPVVSDKKAYPVARTSSGSCYEDLGGRR